MVIVEKDIDFRIIPHPELAPVRGNALASGDSMLDRRVENTIIRQVENGNLWAWCTVEVVGIYQDTLKHSEYLGCCSYKDEADFKSGGYYDDMKQTVLDTLNKQLSGLLEVHC